MMNVTDLGERAVILLLLIVSLAVFVIWPMNLLSGAFPDGVLMSQLESSLPIFHLLAEFLMAGVTLAGVLGMLFRRRWGGRLTLVGLGMLVYAAVNALGWAIVNDPVQGVPMGLTLLVAAFAIPFLLRHERL